MGEEGESDTIQRENTYNKFLPKSELLDRDAAVYLQEIKLNLAQAILDNDITHGAIKWTVNLHKYIILYGLKFNRTDHIYFIKLLFGLFTTKHIDSVNLDSIGKVLTALIKKRFLISRKELSLPWLPLFEMFQFWEDSSYIMRGLIKPATGFKTTLKTIIKFSRGYFTEESTQEMLDKWSHLMCPHDRTICTGVKYFSLFLPTVKDIPGEKSWQLWLPDFNMFWSTWSNSPTWEVELLKLYNRLAFHRVGEVDWEPMMGDLYTRFMTSFNLPVTYGGSGVRIKHGLSGQSCLGSITQWIVATLGPDSSSQVYLSRLLVALQSYYHPANISNSSELLHVFLSHLCRQFVTRLNSERYNRKWQCKTPPEKRLTDQHITEFVSAVKPVAFQVLYNSFEDEARSVFNSLALLAPEAIIPDLLEKLELASETLTEPLRFQVCVQALSACSGPLIRTYPERALDLLNLLLPGIDVNDIWKCTDIFVLMSDLLEMMPVADLTKHVNRNGLSETEQNLLQKTTNFENFVVEFMNRCFTLIENTRRENVRADAGNNDEYLNDEELAADAAVNDTFLRIVANSSPEMFQLIFRKLQNYLRGKIVEPTVAGGILASMCKSVVQSNPEAGLAFFIPYLTDSITSLMRDREGRQAAANQNKIDVELQFILQLLAEVLSVTNVQLYRSRGSDIIPHIEKICSVLDTTLHLSQKDEYELAHNVLQSMLTWLVHVRMVELGPRQEFCLSGWGQPRSLDSLRIEWFIPGSQELGVVRGLIERFLIPLVDRLDRFSRGELEMDKDTLNRSLKLVWRIVVGVSELAPPQQATEWESCLPRCLAWLSGLMLTLPLGGQEQPLREAISNLMSRVLKRIVEVANDDTDSLSTLLNVYDILLLCYGMDEDEISDHIEDHKRGKAHREDRLVKGKLHLPSVHLERISIQWETHIWLKNLLALESLIPQTVDDVFSLAVHQYSEVRMLGQELLLKIVERVGRVSHQLILPRLASCLQNAPGVSEEMFKGALYLINTEKYMFFYSWEAASLLWPALVTAQHTDKQSLDDLLKDIGIKMNRYFQDYALYSLPQSDPLPPACLGETVRSYPGNSGLKTGGSGLAKLSLGSTLHYQALETSVVKLVASKALHWRHHEMAVGMMLSMITYDHTPTRETTSVWLQLLLDDQRTIRMMAYQALEGILKLEKVPSRKVPLHTILPANKQGLEGAEMHKRGFPGLRRENEFLQYRNNMEQGEMEAYWSKPFVVKSNIGYWGWPPKEERARLPFKSEDYNTTTDTVRYLITQFFLDENLVARFVELNSLEHEKGEDFFSMDRGLFLTFVLENLGPRLASVFQTHVERLVSSPEESHQRAAAEMVYGLVRGMRFWDFSSTQQTWSWLLPVIQQVLTNVTTETQQDWDFCFSGATTKADPNRLRPLFELLVTPENLVSQGAFKESSYLLFVTKCLTQNWMVRDLYVRTYNILRAHWDHPYNNVRHQIANTLATLLSMDIPLMGDKSPSTNQSSLSQVGDSSGHRQNGGGGSSSSEGTTGWNLGTGFPTKKLFIDEVIPHLNLHCHNPEFSREETPVSETASTVEDTPNTSSEDVSMSTDMEDEETKRANRVLETVSLWICHQIRVSSVTVSTEIFRLLPYLCQFIGTERDQDVSQSCLQALCYLSACVLPDNAIQPMLDMLKRVAMSQSYKTKMSMLEYIQVAVFTNFLKIIANDDYKAQVKTLVVSLLKDVNLPVRQKAGKILGGLLHSGFISGEEVTSLLTELRSRIRNKMTRAGKKFRKGAALKEQNSEDNSKDRALLHHSGILGLCAFVEAFPYDVPTFVPPILMELSTHINDPQPIPMTIKKTLQEFKRTHQDNWQEHKSKFTEDQLVVMTDLLVSQNYYA